ncbi:hypothetical protein ACTPEF_26485, partial [Clostridioides difficile]
MTQEAQLKLLELTAGKISTVYDSPMGFRHSSSYSLVSSSSFGISAVSKGLFNLSVANITTSLVIGSILNS